MNMHCRVCNGITVRCLDLGNQYLSSVFPENLSYKETERRYPLSLSLCSCGLLQLSDEIDLTQMYKNYPYISSSNKSMRKALFEVARDGIYKAKLKQDDVILDIGCNDGTLLSYFEDRGYELIGVDAATNITTLPVMEFIQGFFNKDMIKKKAKLVFSIAMFYHLNDPVKFSKEVSEIMTEDGIWVIQMAYLGDMITNTIYDNIVHEHACYYGVESLKDVLELAGLEMFDVSFNNLYGGSFRAFVQKRGAKSHQVSNRVRRAIYAESHLELESLSTYQNFQDNINRNKRELVTLLLRLKEEGKSIWVYGASTKGNTILQFCDIDHTFIDAASDMNEFKFGRYMIGSNIPIKNEEDMYTANPDYLLCLPYGFTDSFMKKEESLISLGTKFIRPLPKVEVLP